MSVREVLERDHTEIDVLYADVLELLIRDNGDAALKLLDLLWARLAVHIRAEHHHLFPAVLALDAELRPVIDSLRRDHDFFMRELATAVRELRTAKRAHAGKSLALGSVRARVKAVGNRLADHNRTEEERIYPRDANLDSTNGSDLVRSLRSELVNLPPRFTKAR